MSGLTLSIPRKLRPFITTKKRFKIAYGGRGGAKSMSFADMLAMKAQVEGALVGCLREYQNSLDDSVHSLLKAEINRLQIPGFKTLKNKIDHTSGGGFRFRGLARSIEAVKSMFGFNIFWLEEGQFISADSLKILTPTLREEDSELWVSANPMSISDPFSKRFIVPYQNELNEKGYYEDDLHYIVKINYSDNPWFPASLEAERAHDYTMLPRALYDHIWEGDFNDSVENALILAEWFDACIDAHEVLGIRPLGIRMATHDPSDVGSDDKAFAFRHGSVVQVIEAMTIGNINEGCDWATGRAIQLDADVFTWDCDGMGVGLNRQVHNAFKGKKTTIAQFKGSNSVENPDAVFEAVESTRNQKTNKESFKNKRAQGYYTLRDRILRTYNAVTHGIYSDPEQMISFCSDSPFISQLRTELCRMPIKPNANGMFELYTKEVMKSKFKIDSPNLADCTMQLMMPPPEGMTQYKNLPPVIKPQGEAQNKLRRVR